MDWFTVNNLLLNTGKTKCIRFSMSYMGRVDADLALSGESLDYVDSTEFSGMRLDS